MFILSDDESALIEVRDAMLGVMIAVLALAAWILPERWWPGFASRLARQRTAWRRPLAPEERAMIGIIAGDASPGWMETTYWPAALGHKYLSWMQILACHRPKGWKSAVRLVGEEHVDAALEGGRGVVLFTATFAYKDLMAKAAFASRGYAVNHVSKDTHGFSETRFGKRFLNPIYTSIEERFLLERMVFSGGNTKEVSAKLRGHLRDNRIVMITVTPLGRHVAVRPFLDGAIHMATGGLNFACENDTPVLPVFTIRKEDGGMMVFVGGPLDQPAGASRTEKIDAMLDDYVPRLEAYVRQHPDQFSFPLSSRDGALLLTPSMPRDAVETRASSQQPAA